MKGDAGEKGDRGFQGEVGPAPWRLIGPYNNGLDYGMGDAVTYEGGFYYRTGNPNNPGYPPEPGVINASWTPVADRGVVGPAGPVGQNGSDASVTSGNITSALGYTPDNPTAARTPTAHTHTKSQITDFTHAHAVSEVTGLQTALDGKQASGSYVITTDSRLSDARTPTAHTHTKSQITDFPTLATVATSGSYDDLSNKPSITSFQPDPEIPTDATAQSLTVSNSLHHNGIYVKQDNTLYRIPSSPIYIIFNGSVWELSEDGTVFHVSSNGPAYPWLATWPTITVTRNNLAQIAGKPLSSTASTGISIYAARADHVHPLPSDFNYLSVNTLDAGQMSVNTDPVVTESFAQTLTNKSIDASQIDSGELSDSRLSANVVLTGDPRLSDARTPTAHTHTKSQITDFPTLATVATSGSYADLSNKPTIPTGVDPFGLGGVEVLQGNNVIPRGGAGRVNDYNGYPQWQGTTLTNNNYLVAYRYINDNKWVFCGGNYDWESGEHSPDFNTIYAVLEGGPTEYPWGNFYDSETTYSNGIRVRSGAIGSAPLSQYGSYGTYDTETYARSDHSHAFPSVSDLTRGTLADERLSANVVLTGDPRLSNARTPTAHKSTHATGGSDALTPSDIGATQLFVHPGTNGYQRPYRIDVYPPGLLPQTSDYWRTLNYVGTNTWQTGEANAGGSYSKVFQIKLVTQQGRQRYQFSQFEWDAEFGDISTAAQTLLAASYYSTNDNYTGKKVSDVGTGGNFGTWKVWSTGNLATQPSYSLLMSDAGTGAPRDLGINVQAGTSSYAAAEDHVHPVPPASDITTGTLSDARLSANVPLKNTANTFTTDQTFSGTANTAPNQTAASGSSLMTRDLGDARYLSQPFQLTPAAPGIIAGSTVSYGPFHVVRSDQTWGQGFGNNNVPGVCVPYFFNGSKTISNFALNHTAGTHPTAVLEVGLYQANATTNLPDGYITKVSFPLNETGKKVQTLGSSVTLRGLVWAVIRPTLGDIAFKAGGNGVSLGIAGFNQQADQATYLSFLFGYGPIADGVTNFHGYMTPSRTSSFNPLPTSSIASQIVIGQGGPFGSNAPMVILY
jgi:hypothetical protein